MRSGEEEMGAQGLMPLCINETNIYFAFGSRILASPIQASLSIRLNEQPTSADRSRGRMKHVSLLSHIRKVPDAALECFSTCRAWFSLVYPPPYQERQRSSGGGYERRKRRQGSGSNGNFAQK